MSKIENLPLHFMPKSTLNNIVNDDIYDKKYIDAEIMKIYETIYKIKPVVATLIDDDTGEEVNITLNF